MEISDNIEEEKLSGGGRVEVGDIEEIIPGITERYQCLVEKYETNQRLIRCPFY